MALARVVPARAVVLAGKTLLVLATLVCLASIGGAMLFAFPVLVPLHVVASRGSGPFATGGWALLAGLSIFEAGWMLTYVATEAEALSLATGAVAGGLTAAGVIRTNAPARLAA